MAKENIEQIRQAMISEQVRRVADAMAQEEMPLGESIITKLRSYYSGETTTEEARQELYKKYVLNRFGEKNGNQR